MAAACGGGGERPAAREPSVPAARAAERHDDAFVASIHQLAKGPDPSHEQIVSSLRLLARVLEDLEVGEPLRLARMRALATQLEHSPRTAAHSPLVSAALGEALAMLDGLAGKQPRSRPAFAQALRAYGQIDAGDPLQAQTARVQTALGAIANVVASLEDTPPPFPGIASTAAPAQDTETLRRHLARIESLVSEIAAAHSSSVAHERMITLLRELAGAIRSAPSHLGRDQVDALAMRVMFAATRLEHTGELSFERSDFSKAGLRAAVDALEALTVTPTGSAQAALVERARAAVTRIDEGSTFGFARAQIQDALRAVSDAYLVFARP